MARDDRAWPCRRVRGLAYLHRALRNRGHRCVRPWRAYRGHHRIDSRATRRRVVPAPHRTRYPPVAVAGDELVVSPSWSSQAIRCVTVVANCCNRCAATSVWSVPLISVAVLAVSPRTPNNRYEPGVRARAQSGDATDGVHASACRAFPDLCGSPCTRRFDTTPTRPALSETRALPCGQPALHLLGPRRRSWRGSLPRVS